MIESSLRCSYHPEKNAITKCESCQMAICEECKTIYKEAEGDTDGSWGGASYTYHELCLPCDYDRRIRSLESRDKLWVLLGGIFFIVVASVGFIFVINTADPLIGLYGVLIPCLIGLILILSGIYMFLSAPKKIDKLRKKKDEYYKKASSL